MNAFAMTLLGIWAVNQPPTVGPLVPPVKLVAGEEAVYEGEQCEEIVRAVDRSVRKSRIEVRIFTLEQTDGGPTDLAILTRIWPLADPTIAIAASAVVGRGSDSTNSTAASQLDFVRLQGPNQTRVLVPNTTPPFGQFASAKELLPAPLPLKHFGDQEWRFLVPLGAEPIVADSRWTTLEADRPKMNWEVEGSTALDGAVVVSIVGQQTSDKWANPTGSDDSWQRTDRAWVSPVDGLPRAYRRILERKDGVFLSERRTTSLDLTTPPTPHRGSGAAALRREIEQAYEFQREFASSQGNRAALDRLAYKVSAYLRRVPTTGFRGAIDSIARQLPEVP